MSLAMQNAFAPCWSYSGQAKRMPPSNLKISFEWKAWLGWILATLAGIELCVLCLYHVVFYAASNDLYFPIFGLATLSAAGTILGTSQWFWLRKHLNLGPSWVAATVGGWYLAMGVSYSPGVVRDKLIGDPNPKMEAFFDTFFGLMILILFYWLLSILVSLPQWLLLRHHVQRSGWWVAIRPISWLAGWSLCYLAQYLKIIRFGFFEPDQIFGFQVPEIVGWSVFFLVFGLGFAAVNGAAIVLFQSKPKTPLIEAAP